MREEVALKINLPESRVQVLAWHGGHPVPSGAGWDVRAAWLGWHDSDLALHPRSSQFPWGWDAHEVLTACLFCSGGIQTAGDFYFSFLSSFCYFFFLLFFVCFPPHAPGCSSLTAWVLPGGLPLALVPRCPAGWDMQAAPHSGSVSQNHVLSLCREQVQAGTSQPLALGILVWGRTWGGLGARRDFFFRGAGECSANGWVWVLGELVLG